MNIAQNSFVVARRSLIVALAMAATLYVPELPTPTQWPASVMCGSTTLSPLTRMARAAGGERSTSNAITPIHSITPTIITRISVGGTPHGLALSPDGSQLYVTVFNAEQVKVIDTHTLTITKSIAVGKGPVNVTLNKAGTRAYVTNESLATPKGSLSVIDTTSQSVLQTVEMPRRPHGLMLGPDPITGEVDKRLYVANLGADTLSVLNVDTLSEIAQVPVGNTPDSPLVSADGKSVWVTNYNEFDDSASTVSLVNAISLTEVATVTVGAHPHAIKFAPQGQGIAVSIEGDDQVKLIDPASHTVSSTLAVGDAPHGMNVQPNSNHIWSGDLDGHTVTVIDATNGEALAQVPLGDQAAPHVLVFSANGSRVYIANFAGGEIIVMDTGTRSTQLFMPMMSR